MIKTPLISFLVSFLRCSSSASISIARLQFPGKVSTSNFKAFAILAHALEKFPVSGTKILSPGEKTLTKDASQAPCPFDE